MAQWTTQQQLAIDKEGTNIIVSAGAGSGKTAVLTERVLRKLRNKTSINELLILTFTKAAAYEMKERIREEIIKQPALHHQLDLLEGSYITTFDSYALSVVKKYHVLLNIPSTIQITDASIIYLEKKRCLKEIFDRYYEEEDPLFSSFITSFCVKDDDSIFNACIQISDKLDLKYNKKEYLEQYINTYFCDTWEEERIKEYVSLFFEYQKELDELLTELSYESTDLYQKIKETLSNLLESTDYNSLCQNLAITLPQGRKETEEAKEIRSRMASVLKTMKDSVLFQTTEEMKDAIELTKEHTQVLIAILEEFDAKIAAFKEKYHLYEFQDISKMAIRLLLEQEEVRKEISDSFQEIMVDEYQDTSDLQEQFIQLIQRNNVYMVGDIKQSIYRFRNANPYLFQEKYETYTKNINGYKIDLNQNFRSRREVLDDINVLFNPVMNLTYGQADYKASHQMIFGQTAYETTGKVEDNRHLEILTYTNTEQEFSKREIEIFTIARDIKKKINEGYQIFDKKKKELRPITYKDFAILIDRSTSFDLFQKIFEYLQIPISKYKNTKITGTEDVLLFRNIFLLLLKLSKNELDVDFEYAFVSIARSFLFSYTDQEIVSILEKKNFMETSVIQKINEIDSWKDKSIDLLFQEIIDKFEFYHQMNFIGNMKDHILRLDSLKTMILSLSQLGYSIEDIYHYFDELIKDDYKLEVVSLDAQEDSVKLMTIHTSKGLEFPVCYFPSLDSPFNIEELKSKFLYDNKYGIILPYYKDGVGETIYKALAKKNYMQEEISEKIRLFYVSLTRCREKMIFIMDEKYLQEEDKKEFVEDKVKEKYKSFAHIIKSISGCLSSYKKEIDLKELQLTKEYQYTKKSNSSSFEEDQKPIEKRVVTLPSKTIEQYHFSKENVEFYTKEEKEKMEYGTKIHALFEYIDFKNPKFPEFITPKEKEYVLKFLSCPLDFKNAKIYKEYCFLEQEENKEGKGIIDLMLEYEDEIKIIDYKLSHIDDDAYHKQLEGYKNYIENKTKKRTTTYLYSILTGVLEQINE